MIKTNCSIAFALLLCAPVALNGAAEAGKVHIHEAIFKETLAADQEAQAEGFPRLLSLLCKERGCDERSREVCVEYRLRGKFQTSVPTSATTMSPLSFALYKNHKEAALAIGKAFPDYVHTIDTFGRTPLHFYMQFAEPGAEDSIASIDRNLLDLLEPIINIPTVSMGEAPILKARNLSVLIALHLRGARLNIATIQHVIDKPRPMQLNIREIVAYGFDANKIATLNELGIDAATMNFIRELTESDKTYEKAAALDAHIAAFAPKAQDMITEELIAMHDVAASDVLGWAPSHTTLSWGTAPIDYDIQ